MEWFGGNESDNVEEGSSSGVDVDLCLGAVSLVLLVY